METVADAAKYDIKDLVWKDTDELGRYRSVSHGTATDGTEDSLVGGWCRASPSNQLMSSPTR